MTTFPIIQRRKFYSEVGVEHADEMYSNYIKEQETMRRCLICKKSIEKRPKKTKCCSKKCFDKWYYRKNEEAIKNDNRDEYAMKRKAELAPIAPTKTFDIRTWDSSKADYYLAY